MINVLSCKCGDCTHWEIFDKPASTAPVSTFIKCKTCGDEHRIQLVDHEIDKLEWVPHDQA